MERIENIANQIRQKLGKDLHIDIAIILGSSWGGCVDQMEKIGEIDYTALDGMPTCSVKGHKGRFLFCRCAGKVIGIMQGRFHLYEGYTAYETTIGLQVLNMLGAKKVILTNASGGINKNFSAGDVVIVDDVINFTGHNPLTGIKPVENRPVFISMGNCINDKMKKTALQSCKNLNLEVKQGVYVQMNGPNYETKSEVAMLGVLGADCVGMSTVQEVIMGVYLKMGILALSLVSNMAEGVSNDVLSHNDVLMIAEKVTIKCASILLDLVKNLD